MQKIPKIGSRRTRAGSVAKPCPGDDREHDEIASRPANGSPIDETFLDEQQLAARWNCSPKTLRNHRSKKIGCRFLRIGRLVWYRMSDVIAHETRGSIR
jgi:hypothetical protein